MSAEVDFTATARFFGCACTLRIDAAGVVSTEWAPHPGTLGGASQRRLRSQFATWRNNCVRKWARAHGLGVRPMHGDAALLEPCSPRDPIIEEEEAEGDAWRW
jgi:hypothetical protein